MAISLTNISTPLAGRLVLDTDCDTTVEADVTGTTGSIYMVEIDNTANSHITYVKIKDAATATAGTNDPDWVLMVPASTKETYVIKEGMAFGTALTFWATQEATHSGAATAPGSSVIVEILAT